jgi:hypothetical protein
VSALLLWASTQPLAAEPPAARRSPVVLELFSSEGCSSCPAADAVLAELDAAGEVDGTRVLALELHVDYWDYLGWRDPYSSAGFTARQERYGQWLGARNYTPQLVVDGQAELLGSNRGRALLAVRRAAQLPSPATVELSRQGEALAVRVAMAGGGRGPAAGARVLLAITESGLRTRVPRGENAGQTLAHGPVVRALRPLGVLQGADYATVAPLQLRAGWKRETLRAVVLVQAESDGRILGAGSLAIAGAPGAPGAPGG